MCSNYLPMNKYVMVHILNVFLLKPVLGGGSVPNSDPHWYRSAGSGSRRSRWPTKHEKVKKFHVLECWRFSFEGWRPRDQKSTSSAVKFYNFWSSKPYIRIQNWIRNSFDQKCRIRMEFAPQCCGSGIFIPDPNFSIPDPGSRGKKSRIPNTAFVKLYLLSAVFFDNIRPSCFRQGHTIEMTELVQHSAYRGLALAQCCY